ncbi:swr complex subunit [Apophysomyces sp. BC1034]|nr:swr complex subunit [Apophysomyces sp. BC1034]
MQDQVAVRRVDHCLPREASVLREEPRVRQVRRILRHVLNGYFVNRLIMAKQKKKKEDIGHVKKARKVSNASSNIMDDIIPEKKEKLIPGVYVRSQKISGVKPAMNQKVLKTLADLGIGPRPVMGTAQVCHKYEQLQNSVLNMFDIKKTVDKMETDHRVRAQRGREGSAFGRSLQKKKANNFCERMLEKDQTPPPKAVNIIRPSSPFFQHFKRPVSPHHLSVPRDTSHSSSTASSSSTSPPSTVSALSSASSTTPSVRIPPTVLNPSNFASGFSLFQPPSWTQYAKQSFAAAAAAAAVSQPSSPSLAINTVGLPQKLLQRPKSFSNLSRYTVVSRNEYQNDDYANHSTDEDALDSIDGDTDDDDYEDSEANDSSGSDGELPAKVVAKVKVGTIMNGKGQFVSKGDTETLDDARMHRKIADLEIEKTSLLTLNSTLEATVRRQAEQIAELEKRLHSETNDPRGKFCHILDLESVEISDELTEEEIQNDQLFQRVRSMVQCLIDQAQTAIVQKTKVTGRVLTNYVDKDEGKEILEEYELDLEPPIIHEKEKQPILNRRSWSHTSNEQQQTKRSLRRVSDGHEHGRTATIHHRPGSPITSRQRSMTTTNPPPTRRSAVPRILSRPSSPALTNPPRSQSPRPFSPPLLRTSSRASKTTFRKSQQDMEPPKWHN